MTDARYDEAFAGFATRVAFNITLTRNQIFWLCYIHQNVDEETGRWQNRQTNRVRSRFEPDNFIGGFRTLENRGLVAHNPWWKDATREQKDELHGNLPWTYKLTEAGKHVIALLQISGLVVNAVNNQEEQAA